MNETSQVPDDESFGGVIEEKVDSRDFLAGDISEISGIDEETLPTVVEFPREAVTLDSQGRSVSCTAQATTNAIEIEYFRATGKIVEIGTKAVRLIDGTAASIDAMEQWERQKKYPATAGIRGDWVRSALKAAVYWSNKLDGLPATDKKTGEEIRIKVTGYAKLKKEEAELRKYIATGKAIIISSDVTKEGTNPSNFRIAKTTGTLRIAGRRISGHAWIIGGYDYSNKQNKVFWWANSYGETYGYYKNGTMLLPKSEIPKLDTPWVIFIDDSHLKNRIYKDVAEDDWAISDIRKMLELEIMKGADSDNIENPRDRKFFPNEPVTRRELAVVANRLYEHLKIKSSKIAKMEILKHLKKDHD